MWHDRRHRKDASTQGLAVTSLGNRSTKYSFVRLCDPEKEGNEFPRVKHWCELIQRTESYLMVQPDVVESDCVRVFHVNNNSTADEGVNVPPGGLK